MVKGIANKCMCPAGVRGVSFSQDHFLGIFLAGADRCRDSEIPKFSKKNDELRQLQNSLHD